MAGETNKSPATEITFHYIKSNGFRVAHVDGAVVGVTPSLLVHCALFNERPAIPQQVTHTILPGGTGLGPEQNIISRGGVVREIEVDAMMTLETAKMLRDVLSLKITELEAVRKRVEALKAAKPGETDG